jgi:hypothetical protein
MNGSFDGSGLYGTGQFNALAELGRLWDGPSNGRAASAWKRVVVVLAVVVTPVALVLAGGLSS